MDWYSLFLGIFSGAVGLPSAAVSTRELLSKSEMGNAPGRAAHSPEALTAYLAHENAGAEYLFNLHLIAEVGVPPKLLGGLWTWPIVYRAHRHLVESSSQLLTTFGQMVILGSYEVAERACDFAETLDALTRALTVQRGRIKSNPDFREKFQTATEALRTYMLAVREELNLSPPPPPPQALPVGGGEEEQILR